MNLPPSVDTSISVDTTEKYEALRANALGCLNQPCGLLLFMQGGMSRWLRALAGRGNPATAPHYMIGSGLRTSSDALAGIVADAILEIMGPLNRGEA